jgi:hypothetical protein
MSETPDHAAIAKRARQTELDAHDCWGARCYLAAFKNMQAANSLHRLAYETALGQYAEGEPE